jgi:hypothetical protein
MDELTAFGLFAVTAMLVCYALEDRSHWFILAFAAARALGSLYGFLQGVMAFWPGGSHLVRSRGTAMGPVKYFARKASGRSACYRATLQRVNDRSA